MHNLNPSRKKHNYRNIIRLLFSFSLSSSLCFGTVSTAISAASTFSSSIYPCHLIEINSPHFSEMAHLKKVQALSLL